MMEIETGIRGITDRPRRAPRVGKIKLGLLVANRNGSGEHPEATKYFVVPDIVAESCDLNGELYGPEPTSLDIIFPSNDLSVVAPHNLKQYGAGTGLKCVGNGVNARALVSVKSYKSWVGGKNNSWPEERPPKPPPEGIWGGGDDTKEWTHIPCFGLGYDDAPRCPMIESKACRSVMHLQFIMPTVPGFGIWQMDIGSPISIGNMLNQFGFLGQMVGGKLAGLPMRLEMVPKEVAPDGKRREVHVVDLRYDKSYDELAETPPNLLEAITGVRRLEIDAPDETDIMTNPPDPEETEADAEALDAEPAVVDDDTDKNVVDTFVIPDEITNDNLATLFSWAHGTFKMQPAELLEMLECGNGAQINTRWGSYREAAGEVLRRNFANDVKERFFEGAPPVGDEVVVGHQEPMPIVNAIDR